MSQDIAKDLYFVAVKVFLTDQSGRLLITKDRFNDWDIPGGRLREMDFAVPLAEVLARKIKEELGDNLQYQLGKPLVFMRHERDEILATGERGKRRIFAVGYEAQYLGGEIVVGQSHKKVEWVNLIDFSAADYFQGGWLTGVEEYQKIFKEKNNLLQE